MKLHLKSRAKSVRATFANVTALMALVLVMASVAWAAALPKNSVGTAQLKRNAVTATDIRNRAVTRSKIRNNAINGSKVANNSLTGADINESTLGKVPAAAAADSAGTVATAFGPIGTRIQSSATGASEAAARAAATEVPLLTVGHVSLYAKCFFDLSVNRLHGETIARTAVDGAAMISVEDNLIGDPGFLLTGTPETDRIVESYDIALNSADYTTDSSASIISPDGAAVEFAVLTWLRNGTIPGSSPLLAGTRQCTFQIQGARMGV